MEHQKKSMVWRREDEAITQKLSLHQQRLRKARELRELHSKLVRFQTYLPYLEKIEKGATYAQLYKVSIRKKIETTLKQSLPSKKRDPGSFKVALRMENNKMILAMLDLGSTVNLMPYYMYIQLGLGKLKQVDYNIEMADNSTKTPRGIVENVIVRIHELIIPVDFVIIDTERSLFPAEDPEVLLGRPFMATTRTNIDVGTGNVSMIVKGKSIKFNSTWETPFFEEKNHTEDQIKTNLRDARSVEDQMCRMMNKVYQHRDKEWPEAFKYIKPNEGTSSQRR